MGNCLINQEKPLSTIILRHSNNSFENEELNTIANLFPLMIKTQRSMNQYNNEMTINIDEIYQDDCEKFNLITENTEEPQNHGINE